MLFSIRHESVPEGIRTPDLLVRSQTLYPAELQAHGLTTGIIISRTRQFVNAFFHFVL